MTSPPRVLTNVEVQEQFLRCLWSCIGYWRTQAERHPDGWYGAMEGLVFSLLAAIDGANASLPAFILAPLSHEDDAAYCRGIGENWFPRANPSAYDIAGTLHERFLKLNPYKEDYRVP